VLPLVTRLGQRYLPGVSGSLLGFLALALLAATGLSIAAALPIRRPVELVLSVYVIAWVELIGLFLSLSAFDAVTRTGLLAGLVLVFVAALATVFIRGGTKRPPSLPRRAFGDTNERLPLVLLTVVVSVGLAYIIALIVGTPPNGWDPMNYHLARAAFWLQSGGIGYIKDAYDQRLNFNPPNGEIGFAFVLGVTREENLVGFVQFFAALACATGVFAVARGLGLGRGEAAFGGLVFLSLPLVALQSSGAKNDLIVASFLVAAVPFLLGDSRREIALGSITVALAVGTKFTAAYGLAILLAIVLVASRRTRLRLPLRIAGLLAGGTAGSYWYFVNAHETGHFLGDQSNVPGLTAPLHPPENLLSAFGTLVDWLDLSGARGADVLIYPLAGIVVAIALRAVYGEIGKKSGLVVAVVVGVLPLLLLLVSKQLGRPALIRLDDALGHPKGFLATGDSTTSSPTTASDTASWYGPAGLLLVTTTGIAALSFARRKSLAAPNLVCALAPLGMFTLVALTLTYNPWLGRFFIFPVTLSAALWGLALRSKGTAWATAALAGVTLVLSLVHYAEKPSGLRLLDRTAPSTSVWTMKRWQVQSQHDPAIGPVFRFLDQDVPRRASIGLALGANDFGYPAFGPHLDRRVELVPFGSSARELDVGWLLATQERTAEIDHSCWRESFRSDEATVFRRADSCNG
jgi:hypothetical protein